MRSSVFSGFKINIIQPPVLHLPNLIEYNNYVSNLKKKIKALINQSSTRTHYPWPSSSVPSFFVYFPVFLTKGTVVISVRNVPHRLRYLRACFPASGTVWGDGASWQEEECPWRWAGTVPGPSLCFTFRAHLSASCSCLRACCLLSRFPATIHTYPSGTVSQNKLFLPYVAFGHSSLSEQQESEW